MATRVTQVAVEALVQSEEPKALVTQHATEVLVKTNPKIRITQFAVEVLVVQRVSSGGSIMVIG